jgi:hypothetical protein
LKTADSILKAIAYFDVFRYPVTADEYTPFMDQSVTTASLYIELNSLLARKKIYRLGDYYSLQDEPLLAEQAFAGK